MYKQPVLISTINERRRERRDESETACVGRGEEEEQRCGG